ncbi:hypothetical protein [Plantactinospora sp. CA-290183]|uniref:hypothetical protein n=1 Tax=Plantactinospora sp. CA-290183 TaxID=3240006 RepID=UPI003D8F8B26
MGVWTWWRERGVRRAAAIERAWRERDAAEAEAARQRLLDLARRQRYDGAQDPGPTLLTWNGPTLVVGLPLLTYGQRRQYRTGRC